MNIKEVAEVRRHVRRDRSNMTAIYGCYVNESKEIISEFRCSTGMMSENEGEKYFGLLEGVGERFAVGADIFPLCEKLSPAPLAST